MRLASIDIGSNTIRLLVADVRGGKISPLRHERKVTRLAAGLHLSGRISDIPLHETVKAVRAFAAIAGQEGAERTAMAGTSALRQAQNAPDAAVAIEEATGLKLDIITGHQEAEIMAMGVLSGLEARGNALIFDIGGGSTELIALNNGTVLKTVSYEAGVVRMMEEFVHSDPPSQSDMDTLDKQAATLADEVTRQLGAYADDITVLIGTAGTATALASLDMELDRYDWQRVQGHVISLERLRELEARIKSLSLEKRREIRGMDPERADLIIAGTRITIRTMEALDFEHLTVSDYGLLEGLAVKLSNDMGY